MIVSVCNRRQNLRLHPRRQGPEFKTLQALDPVEPWSENCSRPRAPFEHPSRAPPSRAPLDCRLERAGRPVPWRVNAPDTSRCGLVCGAWHVAAVFVPLTFNSAHGEWCPLSMRVSERFHTSGQAVKTLATRSATRKYHVQVTAHARAKMVIDPMMRLSDGCTGLSICKTA